MNRSFVLQSALPAALLGACASLFPFDATASGRMATALVPLESSDTVVRAPAKAPASESPWVYLGPQRAQVNRLAISPQDPQRLLALLGNQRDTPVATMVYQTDVDGHDWGRADGLGLVINDITTDASMRDIAAHSRGLLYHPAGGSGWDSAEHPEHGMAVGPTRLAAAPGTQGALWITATFNGAQRVYRLSHDLLVWDDVTPALPPTMGPMEVAVSDIHAGRVAVAVVDSSTGALRVFTTSDDGASWTMATAPGQVASLSALRWVGERLFVGGRLPSSARYTLWASEDAGASFEVRLTSVSNLDSGMDVAGDPSQPDHLWAGTADGLYRSTDGGHTWSAPGPDQADPITQLAYAPQSQTLWAARRDTGTWASSDAGDTWQPRNHRLGVQPVTSVSAHPHQPGELAVGISDFLFPRGQVSTSANGGLDWLHNVAPASSTIGAVRFATSGALYATLTGGQQSTLYRRAPGGTWQPVGFQVPGTSSFTPGQVNFGATEDTLLITARVYTYATGKTTHHVWRSGDAGQSWQLVMESDHDGSFAAIERTRTDTGVQLFVFERVNLSFESPVGSRLWTSHDDGLSWSVVSDDLPLGYSGNVCTGSDGQVLLELTNRSTHMPRLHRSDDGGATWRQTAWSPGFAEVAVTAMHCPGDAGRVFLGGHYGRMWMSADGGESFDTLLDAPQLMGNTWVRSIQLTPTGLYMGLMSGLWVNPDITQPLLGPYGLVVAHSSTGARMRTRVHLAWQGGAEHVDIRLDGAVVAHVENTGAWSQSRLATGQPEAWQVCNAGTEECSAVVGDN